MATAGGIAQILSLYVRAFAGAEVQPPLVAIPDLAVKRPLSGPVIATAKTEPANAAVRFDVLDGKMSRVNAKIEQLKDSHTAILQFPSPGIFTVVATLRDPPPTNYPPRAEQTVKVFAVRIKRLGPIEDGKFVDNKILKIDKVDPKLPTVEAEAELLGLGAEESARQEYKWQLEILFDPRKAPKGPSAASLAVRKVLLVVEPPVGGYPPHGWTVYRYSNPPKPEAQVVQGQIAKFEMPDLFGQLVRGGKLKVELSVELSGQVARATSDKARIVGQNPEKADLLAVLPNNTLKKIACQESGQMQFLESRSDEQKGSPNYSSDRLGGVGLFQITVPPPTEAETWDWLVNAAGGISMFEKKLEKARSYVPDLAKSEQFNAEVARYRKVKHLPATYEVELRPWTDGDLDEHPKEVQQDAIRGFNGWAGQGEFGRGQGDLHEFRVATEDLPLHPGSDITKSILRVVEKNGRHVAEWVHVAPKERPYMTEEGTRVINDYVERVLGHALNCGQGH